MADLETKTTADLKPKPPKNPSKEEKKTLVKCYLINAHSASKHRTELRDLIEETDLDMLLVTESWFREESTPIINQITPPNYLYITKNRDARGGGLAIFHKEHITIEEDGSFKIDGCEHLLIKCKFNENETTSLLLIYRPPPEDKDFPDNFADQLPDIILKHNNLIILGDFNIKLNTREDRISNNFLDNMEALNFQQGVIGPTQEKGNTLDGIFYSDTTTTVGEAINLPWTDHKLIPFTIEKKGKDKGRRKDTRTGRRWKTLDIQNDLIPRIIKNLPNQRTQPERPATNPTEINPTVTEKDKIRAEIENEVTLLETWITKALDDIIPKKQTKSRSTKKPNRWYTNTLDTQKRKCREWLRKWQKNKSKENLLGYRLNMRHYRKLIENSRKAHYSQRIEQAAEASKELFKIINELKNNKKKAEEPDNEEFCKKMATHFKEKEKTLDQKIKNLKELTGNNRSIPLEGTTPTTPTMNKFHIPSKEEYFRFIRANHSAGSLEDPCPQHIYKTLASSEIIGTLIWNIITKALSYGVMPQELKTSHIKPLLKKIGLDPAIGDNFRAIARSKYLGKIIEKLVATQVNQHLENNNLLDSSQSGFRPRHSTETVTISILDDLKIQADQQGAAVLILLDLSAAFDTVQHDTLLERCRNVGIKDNCASWIREFLTDRKVKVTSQNHSSEAYSPEFGVPQGSPLSPILFNIYLKPLGDIIRKHGLSAYNYADDTQLIWKIDKTGNTNPETLTNCIKEITIWMTNNHLLLNPGKTEVIAFGNKELIPDPLPWPAELGSPPTANTSAKSLGLIISDNINPLKNAKETSRKCFHILRLLKKIFPILTYKQRVTAVTALVLNRLDYSNGIYAGASAKCINTLQRVQNAAARLLTRTPQREHITPALAALHWLPISRRITYKILLLTHQVINTETPSYLQHKIKMKQGPRTLRNTGDIRLEIPKVRTKKWGEASFTFQAPRIWHLAPPSIRKIKDRIPFKKRTKTWLFVDHNDNS